MVRQLVEQASRQISYKVVLIHRGNIFPCGVCFPFLLKSGEIHMNELQIFKTFIKYRVLLLQQYQEIVDRLDIDSAKEDLRKIGLTFVGASLLGLVLQKADVVPGVILFIIGLSLWYKGLTKRVKNE